MEAKVHFEVFAKDHDFKMVRTSIFVQSRYTRAIFKLHKDTLLTLSQTISEGDSFFPEIFTVKIGFWCSKM